MRIISDNKKINRNKKIGKVTTITSLVILGIGLVISFQNKTETLPISLGALVVGFFLSQIGIYFTNRWGKSPRPDEKLAAKLKGLDDKYTLYNYTAPVSHLLLGPAGIWVLLPYSQNGRITYDSKKGRWQQKGGNAYLKLFAQEGLGRPDVELEGALSEMGKFIQKNLPGEDASQVQAALVFTNEKVELQVTDSPAPTLVADKLKDFIRKRAKEQVNPQLVQKLQDCLPKSVE